MILRLAALQKYAASHKPGWLEMLIDNGSVCGDCLVLEEAAWQEAKRAYLLPAERCVSCEQRATAARELAVAKN